MKLNTSMITTSEANRKIRPPTLSLVLLATKLKKGILYNNKVPMLTIHEKERSEMGLWNILIICLSVFFFEFQKLVLAKVENQTRHRESNDATHTYI